MPNGILYYEVSTELQGEGTYEYRCRKKDCSHCEMMKPKLMITPINKAVSLSDAAVKNAKKPKAKMHPPQQMKWPKFRNSTMVKISINN